MNEEILSCNHEMNFHKKIQAHNLYPHVVRFGLSMAFTNSPFYVPSGAKQKIFQKFFNLPLLKLTFINFELTERSRPVSVLFRLNDKLNLQRQQKHLIANRKRHRIVSTRSSFPQANQ